MGQLSKRDDQRRAFTQQAERYRDAADEDYITARSAYKNNLPCAFLTSAHQCVEKYLKSILLFNSCSTNKFSHDLAALVEELDKKVGFVLQDVPAAYIKFVREYLNVYGFNRYLDSPLAFGIWGGNTPELLALDWIVWYLRRYTKNLFYGDMCGKKLNEVEQIQIEQENYDQQITYLRSPKLKNRPHSYKINRGFLEKVLSEKCYRPARNMLVWKNPCFGGQSRKKLRNYPINSKFISGRERLIGFDLVKDQVKGHWNQKRAKGQ
ncbi:MAG: HEPN domain-containing protein [Deltaproteobacteria bacterium]|nr:HEPN domain-containing protein [Deltaproteobacteria bacterium]